MTLEEIQESKAKEYGFKTFKDLEKSEYGSDPHWNVREDIAYTYVEYLESQTQELQDQNTELVNIIKDLIPMAEDGYRLHKNNGSHQDFLEDDRDILKKAKELLTKHNHLNKKK